ncbi:MAG TPA: hypothetical protein VHE30_26540 [Polyangiaceae bacterium]|nr:hypothetical protein [Polyangiaceae bacterium]
MKPRFLFAAMAAVSVTHAGSGWAQAFLSDPRVANGMGVKAGDFELHPGVAGEVGYDSNYFQRKGNSTTQPPSGPPSPPEPLIGAYRLRVTPSLSFETMGRRTAEEGGGPPPTLKLNGRLAASYNALFASDSQYSSQVSNQSNYISGNAGLGLDILPESVWGADLGGDVTRVIEASNDPDTANAFRRDTIHGKAGINFRPGGGLFTWRLGYGFTANIFEESGFKGLNNTQHSAETQGNWTFLPRTALVYRGELTWVSYGNSAAAANARHDGSIVRSQIGLNGLFTNHLGFLGLIGWGASFFDGATAQNVDTVIGQAEITWFPTPQPKLPSEGAPVGLSAVSLGYTRNFAISYLGDYYRRDRGYASLSYFLANRFVLTLTGGLSAIARPPVVQSGGAYQAPDGEKRVDAVAFFEYRPGDALGINLTFRYDAELDHAYIATDDLMFSRYQAFLGLRWFL